MKHKFQPSCLLGVSLPSKMRYITAHLRIQILSCSLTHYKQCLLTAQIMILNSAHYSVQMVPVIHSNDTAIQLVNRS